MIYLDNAATSYPKPEQVVAAVVNCLEKTGANPGRSSHKMAMDAARVIYNTRKSLAAFIGARDAADVVFTYNATDALNMALKGVLRSGDRVVTTSMEHNAVSRPLDYLTHHGAVEVATVPAREDTLPDLDKLREAIAIPTKLVVFTHASNVTGAISPVEEIAEMAHAAGAMLLVDAAQTVGSLDVDVVNMGIDLLAIAGHKALLGPQGVGALYISPDLELRELRQGGTGGDSALHQPTHRPDRYEAGTPNTPGIAGLGAAVGYLEALGKETIRRKEVELTAHLIEALRSIEGLIIYGPLSPAERVPLVTFNIRGFSPQALAMELDRRFSIAVRAGMHCAPHAHRSLGTHRHGAVRASLSIHNDLADIAAFREALSDIIAHGNH